MKIVGFRHKGIARLYAADDASRLDARVVAKLRLQLAVLDDLAHSDELRALAFWKAHRLSDGRWSFHVTANWRLTFAVDDAAGSIGDVDLEDYH